MRATYWDLMLGFKSMVAISPISVYEAKHQKTECNLMFDVCGH
jgi:hypothetical protein